MSDWKSFAIPSGDDELVPIRITELPGVRAENLGLKTWGAAWILSNQIYNLRKYAPRRSNDHAGVLEIGAGTALTGLAAAAIWQCDTVLTDLPSIVGALEANVVLNDELLKQRQAHVLCGTLDWFNPKVIRDIKGKEPMRSDGKKFEVILAADTLYYDDHPRLMADTIFEWLAKTSSASFIVCYAQRIAYLDHIRELWTLLEEGGLASVDEGLERGDATWDEEAPFEWAVFRWTEFLQSN